MAVVCGHSFARHCPNLANRKSRSVQTASRDARMRPFANICRYPVLYSDLNDVHTLQTNLFGFLHHVVQGLRKKGVRRIPSPISSRLAYPHVVSGTDLGHLPSYFLAGLGVHRPSTPLHHSTE